MKKFKYTATNLYGKKFKGVFLAEDEDDLRAQLAKQNLFLVNSKVTTDKSPSRFFSLTGKVSYTELCTFCRQFAILVDSGTFIIDALNILRNQSYSGYLKKVLDLVYEDVKSGKLLSESLAKHKKTFPNFFVSMVRIGESSGQISNVLITVADYLEADAKIRAKTKSALAYPCFLVVLAFALIVLMMAVIIPTFQEALSALDVEMPDITLKIFALGEWFKRSWKNLALIVIAVVLLFVLLINTKSGRLLWDKIKFQLPGIGNVIKNNVSSRFCRAFSLLISSGMDVIDAMDEVVVVLGNAYVAQQFKLATEDVRHGMSITTALQGYKLFPDMLVQMVAVGESTDKLDSVLAHAGPFFETQVERALTSITSLIQPIILLFIGLTVGILFYAVYSPMLEIMNSIDQTAPADPDVYSLVIKIMNSLG